MKVSDVGYELSIRLGDPVGKSTPDGQGLVFSGEERFRYITRAYSKLSRMLRVLMRDYQPEFNKRKKVTVKQFLPLTPPSSTHPSKMEIKPSIKIDELFVGYSYQPANGTRVNKAAPAALIDSARYLSNLHTVNDVKPASFDEGKFKYVIMNENNKPYIYLLPEATAVSYYLAVYFIETPDFEFADWESEVPVTNDYIDLLVDLATIQGMQDIARADKVQLIERSIATDWQILGQYGTYMKQTEGVKE